MTDFLIEVNWKAPIAAAVREVLRCDDITLTTAQLPGAVSRGFCVVQSSAPEAVEDLARSLREAGADVTVVAS